MAKEQSIYVSYSQVAIFRADLENPFNDWSTNHVLQGFAWRPESVSFGTLEQDGDLRIALRVMDHFDKIKDNTVRAIRVPFSVRNGLIEVASISDGFKAQIPSGDYSLYFETGKDEKGMWCVFTFVEMYDPQPEILICDHDLQPGKSLIMKTDPAA